MTFTVADSRRVGHERHRIRRGVARNRGSAVILAGTIGASLATGTCVAFGLAPGLLFVILTLWLFALAVTRLHIALIVWVIAFAFVPDSVGLHTLRTPLTGRFVLTYALLIGILCSRVTLRALLPTALRWPFYLFVAGIGLSAAATPRLGSVLDGVQILAFTLLAFVCGYSLNERERGTLTRAAVWAASALALLALAELVLGRNPYAYLPGFPNEVPSLERVGYVRSELGFGQPLALGAFLAVIFGVALLNRRYVAATVIGLGTLATVSRGPIVTVVVLLVGFVMLRPSLRRVVALGTIIAAVTLAPGSFPRSVRSYFASSLQLSHPTATQAPSDIIGRLQLGQAGWTAMLHAPLAGHGLGTASSGHATYVQANGQVFGDIANEYLTVGLEGGMVALAGFSSILLVLMWRLRWNARNLPVLAQVLIWATVALLNTLPIFFFLAGVILRDHDAQSVERSLNTEAQLAERHGASRRDLLEAHA